jgi:hypothetical protein
VRHLIPSRALELRFVVAIVASNGLGLLDTSLNIIGEAGVLARAYPGKEAAAFVNAVTGTLVLQMQDEQLAGRGLDLYALRTYNQLTRHAERR